VQSRNVIYCHSTLSSTAPATSTNFNQNMPKIQAEYEKNSRLELTKINLLFNSIKHAMSTTCQAKQFVKVSSTSLQSLLEILTFACQLVQINSSILQQFHYSHFDCLVSCISWHNSLGDVHSFLLLQSMFCFV
jgi:hypothetical protein